MDAPQALTAIHVPGFPFLLAARGPASPVHNVDMSSAAVQLGNYQVGADRLSSLYYIPNYITESEEQLIMREVHASQAKWVQVRRTSKLLRKQSLRQ